MTSTPAIAPMAAEMPQPSMRIRPTGMPASAADSRLLAVARICRPSRVLLNRANMIANTAATMSQTPMLAQYRRAPNTLTYDCRVFGNRLGMDWSPLPQIRPSEAFSTENSPSRTIRVASRLRFSIGRTSTRSDTAPSANPATAATSRHTATGTFLVVRPQARYVVNSAISPWAKLMVPVAR